VQPSGGDELGIRAIRRGTKQVRDFSEMVDIRLIATPLPRHANMPARGKLSSFGDEAERREHR
jgi:hypothetical protein